MKHPAFHPWFWRCTALALACLVASGSAQAEPSDDTLNRWLPSATQVAAALNASPTIAAARAQREAQLERAQAIQVGPHEWALRLSQHSRRVQDPSSRFNETSATLERPVRLWGKADLDRQLAEQNREVARIGLADALHEASRQLMLRWIDVLRAQREAASATRELALAQSLHRQALVRLRQGDIAPLDARLAEAELQRAQAMQLQAQARQTGTQASLLHLYPGLTTPAWPQADTFAPTPGEEAKEALRIYLSQHHELKLMRAEALRLQGLADRLDKDRWPDPTLGVYTSRERAGAEQVLGLSLSVPLPGQYRQSQARAAQAEAQVAQDKLRQMELQLGAEFAARWQQWQQGQQALVATQAAAEVQSQAAEKSLLAYTLGEHSMTELIQNRRLANEQRLARDRLQLDQVQGWALLQLDLHRIWDLDD